jgi:5-hydroxyisourate hydrolase
MTSLSTHVLDLEAGTPAEGLRVALFRGHDRLADGQTSANGRIAELGHALDAGSYRLEFDVAAYLKAKGRAAPFLQRVSLEFVIDGSQPHYHVPLLMTPYACTSYRGS